MSEKSEITELGDNLIGERLHVIDAASREPTLIPNLATLGVEELIARADGRIEKTHDVIHASTSKRVPVVKIDMARSSIETCVYSASGRVGVESAVVVHRGTDSAERSIEVRNGCPLITGDAQELRGSIRLLVSREVLRGNRMHGI